MHRRSQRHSSRSVWDILPLVFFQLSPSGISGSCCQGPPYQQGRFSHLASDFWDFTYWAKLPLFCCQGWQASCKFCKRCKVCIFLTSFNAPAFNAWFHDSASWISWNLNSLTFFDLFAFLHSDFCHAQGRVLCFLPAKCWCLRIANRSMDVNGYHGHQILRRFAVLSHTAGSHKLIQQQGACPQQSSLDKVIIRTQKVYLKIRICWLIQ